MACASLFVVNLNKGGSNLTINKLPTNVTNKDTIATTCAFSNTLNPNTDLMSVNDHNKLTPQLNTKTSAATVEFRFQNNPAIMMKKNGTSQANNQVIARMTLG